ncbi:ubiquinol-cytochrome c reductase iron-sulfur subunit [Aquiflexum sp.]|uniref:QcrA and Rieske domain-containing protein n=1 Tax=Aquiflexum sp. TaxID=1872584 RepID=UPI003593B38D
MKTTTNIKSGSLSEARRNFLKKSGSLAVMSMFGVAFFTSCSSDDMDPDMGSPTTPPATGNGINVTADAVTVDLAVASNLAAAGGWALVTAARVLIVNMGNNNFNALTSVCTHSQCDRNWTFTNNVFTCTCHGSRFNTNGSVVNGPATQALRSYPAMVTNNVLTVDLG